MTVTTERNAKQITHDDILRLAGELGELKIASIMETGGTVGDLEEACALLSGDGEATGGRPADLSGPVAEIYDILTIEVTFEEDR